MVWRPDPTAPQGLTLFGVAMAGTSGRLVEDYFLEIGALQTGTFAGRPYDTLGFVINTQKFSPLALGNIILAQASLGINRQIPNQQVMMELNYGIQVTPRDPPDAEPAIHHQPRPDSLSLPHPQHPGRPRCRRQALGGPVHPGGIRQGAGELVRGPVPSSRGCAAEPGIRGALTLVSSGGVSGSGFQARLRRPGMTARASPWRAPGGSRRTLRALRRFPAACGSPSAEIGLNSPSREPGARAHGRTRIENRR